MEGDGFLEQGVGLVEVVAVRLGQGAIVGGQLLLALQGLVEGQRFPDHGLGLVVLGVGV